MSDESTDADERPDPDAIDARIERVERIIERLETEDLSTAEATRLHREAKDTLADLEADVDVGDGAVVERDE